MDIRTRSFLLTSQRLLFRSGPDFHVTAFLLEEFYALMSELKSVQYNLDKVYSLALNSVLAYQGS
jgi:hypothetical protein